MEKSKNYLKLWVEIILGIVITIIIIITAIILYFYNADIESKVPEDIKQLCNIEEYTYQNRKVFEITSNEAEQENLILFYIHGGSYVGEILREYWDFFKDIVNDTGYTIIAPDYPLAPKYNYKDVFNMVEPLYKETINKYGAENVILIGDSSGGGVALSLAEKMQNQGFAKPQQIILISPWLDITLKNPKIAEMQKYDKVLNREILKFCGELYVDGDNPNTYLVSPINGNLKNLDNITIFTGTYDILNPDVYELVDKAKEIGIEIRVIEEEKAEHVWFIKRHLKKVYKGNEGYEKFINVIEEVSNEKK